MNDFHKKGYVGVKEIISKEIVDLVSQYALLDELTDYQTEIVDNTTISVKNTHSKYADTLMESLLLQLKPKIEYVAEMELLPTYSYYRVYRSGSILKSHVDRPACEVSSSVCFNYYYEDETDTLKWPIFFNDNPIFLDPGDAVIYKGIDIPHWRNELKAPKLSYHIQGFFHYVNKNGPNVDHALDNRLFIGEKKKTNNKFKKSYLSTIN